MPDELSVQLGEAVARLIGRPVTNEDRFGLAVSGGADSMAMLALAHACWPGRIEAATVDHGLRPDAREEAQMVADWCAEHHVPHAILSPDRPISGSVQAEARAARYALLEAWRIERGLDWLLTAHHADDQFETVLLRLGRGSGVGGLAAVRARRGAILRPMLGMRRADLRDYCDAEDVPYVDDPSNADERFDRARLRRRLAGLDLIDLGRLNRSVEALAEADAALDWMTDEIVARHLRENGDALVLDRTDLPPAILRRLLLRMISSINENAEIPRGPTVDQALVQLFDGKAVSLGDCVVTGGGRWTIRRAPARKT
ncbi:MAG: tRNA lysidine(34) synthetase TilS [Sphingobium sp.]|nr:tRNA lysidine(34) synthetase TilS [Sphingobium sp.]